MPVNCFVKADEVLNIGAFESGIVLVVEDDVLLRWDLAAHLGRAQVEVVIRHRQSGMELKGTHRQFVTFQNSRLSPLKSFMMPRE